MENLSFVIWMLLWWLVCIAEDYLNHRMGRKFSDEVRCFGAWVRLAAWIIVGALLYE